MEDPLSYTYDGLERELNLLEIHLKEAPKGDEVFCKDCINKHISTSRGFALEGPSFTDDKEEQEKFLQVEKQLREIKDKNYKRDGVKIAQKVRDIRKSLNFCPECELPKHLNNPSTSNNYTHNSGHISDPNQLNGEQKKKMVNYAELGLMNVGQFAAEGVRYLAETQFPLQEKWVTIGGGVALQALGLFVKMPKMIKTFTLVTGSNLLAGGVVKLIKGTPVVGVRAAVAQAGNPVGKFTGRPNARVFGGPVTATNIPTQYARAGILSGAQAFESPEHADLIRVD